MQTWRIVVLYTLASDKCNLHPGPQRIVLTWPAVLDGEAGGIAHDRAPVLPVFSVCRALRTPAFVRLQNTSEIVHGRSCAYIDIRCRTAPIVGGRAHVSLHRLLMLPSCFC